MIRPRFISPKPLKTRKRYRYKKRRSLKRVKNIKTFRPINFIKRYLLAGLSYPFLRQKLKLMKRANRKTNPSRRTVFYKSRKVRSRLILPLRSKVNLYRFCRDLVFIRSFESISLRYAAHSDTHYDDDFENLDEETDLSEMSLTEWLEFFDSEADYYVDGLEEDVMTFNPKTFLKLTTVSYLKLQAQQTLPPFVLHNMAVLEGAQSNPSLSPSDRLITMFYRGNPLHSIYNDKVFGKIFRTFPYKQYNQFQVCVSHRSWAITDVSTFKPSIVNDSHSFVLSNFILNSLAGSRLGEFFMATKLLTNSEYLRPTRESYLGAEGSSLRPSRSLESIPASNLKRVTALRRALRKLFLVKK